MITKFVSKCFHHQNTKIPNFGVYFKQYYASRPEEWVLCLRSQEAYTTNMACEAFHHMLKYNAAYMNGKMNVRLDHLLSHLFSYVAEMKHRLLKSSACNGNTGKQSTSNFKAHKAASGQSFLFVSETTNGWNVQSFNKPGVLYEVTETNAECTFQPCSLVCKTCSVCWHLYSCTCPEAVNAHNRHHSCKHAHLVKMFISTSATAVAHMEQTTSVAHVEQTTSVARVEQTTSVAHVDQTPVKSSVSWPSCKRTPIQKQKRREPNPQQLTKVTKERSLKQQRFKLPTPAVRELKEISLLQESVVVSADSPLIPAMVPIVPPVIQQLYTYNGQTPHTYNHNNWVQTPPQAPPAGYPQFYANYAQVPYPMSQPMNMYYPQWYHY